MLTHKIKDKMNLESKRLSRKYAEDKRPGQKYVRVTLPDSIQEHLDGYMVMDCYDHNNDVVIKCKTNVLFRLLYEFDREHHSGIYKGEYDTTFIFSDRGMYIVIEGALNHVNDSTYLGHGVDTMSFSWAEINKSLF